MSTVAASSATPEPGLRERKRQQTMAAIERAAIEAAYELGFDGASVDIICERAGVSPRTFFNYVGTKDQAIVGLNAAAFDADAMAAFESGTGSILDDAIELIDFTRKAQGGDHDLARKRREIIHLNPSLMDGFGDRMRAVADQLNAAVIVRLARERGVEPTAPELVSDARMLLHLVISLMHYVGDAIAAGAPDSKIPALVADGRAAIQRLLD
ncbi:MAG: TetR/AcrR family transcriptional regulator [Microbacterium sp.]